MVLTLRLTMKLKMFLLMSLAIKQQHGKKMNLSFFNQMISQQKQQQDQEDSLNQW